MKTKYIIAITKKSNYIRIKEKVIRHTIHIYGIDISIFKSIIKDIFKKIENNKYKKYLFTSHIEGVIETFSVKKCFNIRIFLSYLDLSKKLFDIKVLAKNDYSFEKNTIEITFYFN